MEKLQKAAVYIILGNNSTSSYENNLSLLDLHTLKERRQILCKNFAEKVWKHPEHKQMFQLSNDRVNTRSGRRVIVPKSSTQRYENSAVPSLARILNNEN